MNTPQTAIAPDQVISKSENFVESEVNGQIILMHLEDGNFSSLEATGQRIWGLLETPMTLDDLCAALMAEFEVDEATCRAQTVTFLEELRANALIDVSS